MLTGKQKRHLRSLAHHIKPVYQIGKDGVNENMISDILKYLNKHEIMKVSVLQNCMSTAKELVSVFEDNDIYVAQVIGSTLVLYKESKNKEDKIILP